MAVVACATAASPLRAADEDTQIWTQLLVTTPLSGKLTGVLELQPRVSGDGSRLEQFLLRPSLSLRLDPTTAVSLGYAYVRTEPEGGRPTDEHRIWQQVSFRLKGGGAGPTADVRTRLEQRFFEGGGGTGWRLRQQVRATAPIGGGVRAVLWTEPWFNLNDTRWGQRTGLDRWRNFAGVNVPLRKGVSLEPGYLNQYVSRRGEDRMNHVLSVTLTVAF